MKYAKSMYRGGFIVDVIGCDYGSSKLLGLVCPFCSQAVFVRKQTQVTVQGKTHYRRSLFAHYPSQGTECEIKSKTVEGRKILESIRSESRNQRLSIYCERLSSFLLSRYNEKILNDSKKLCGDPWIYQRSKECHRSLKDELTFYKELTEGIIKTIPNINPNLIDILNKEISLEILSFLASDSGFFVIKEIILGAINSIGCEIISKSPYKLTGDKLAQRVKSQKTEFFVDWIIGRIALNEWTLLFES